MTNLIVKYFINRLPTLLECQNKLEVAKAIVARSDPKKIILANGAKIVSPQNNNFFQLINEVYIKKVYTPVFLPIGKGDVVVDIGANIGVFSTYAATLTTNTVYAYEPYSHNFTHLVRNTKGFENIIAHKCAVANKTGFINLSVSPAQTDHFLANLEKSGKGTVKVRCVTLEQIFLENRLKKINFIKLDCEGAEGLIFKSTPKSYLERIGEISLEYHDHLSPMDHNQIASLLKSLHFWVKIIPNANSTGYIYAKR